jgi:hypothetical protein
MQMEVFPSVVEEAASIAFSPSYALDFFAKNQMAITVLIYIWVFFSVPLFFCQYQAVFIAITYSQAL